MAKRRGNIYGKRTARKRMRNKRHYYVSRGGIRL